MGDTYVNPQTGQRIRWNGSAWEDVPQNTQSSGETFTRRASSGILQNAMQMPLNYLGSYVDAFIGTGGMRQNGVEGAGEAVRGLAPSQDQIMGGAQMVGERAAQAMTGSDIQPATFQQATANQQAISQQGQEQNPVASVGGDITADVASLMGIRAPGSRSRAMMDFNQARGIRVLNHMAERGTTSPAAKSFRDLFLTSFSNSPLAATFTRGMTKGAEAGVDGLLLGAMNNQDPVETAAIGAGAQLGGSALLSMLTGFKGAGSLPTRLALEAAGLLAIIQVGRSVIPGEDASVVEDAGSAFDKIVAGALLGVGAGLGGAGRVTGTKAFERSRELLPVAAEMAQTFQRGLSLSALNRMFADDRVEPVLNALVSDPTTFGPTATRRIRRAISNPDIDLSETLDSLSSDSRFKNILEQLQQ